MNKIIDFVKEKYKVFIPILFILVILIVGFFFYNEYKYEYTLEKKTYKAYKEILGSKLDFDIDIYSNKRGVIKKLNSNKDVSFDSNPIYFSDKDKVLFPREMDIIFPYENNVEYSTSKYSVYEKKGNLHYINNEGNNKDYLYFFMYDGDDLYFFIDEVTLYVGGKEYTKLSGMSYVSLVGDTLIYYNKDSDKSEAIDINSNDSVNIENKFISIDMRSNKLGKSKLLSNNLEGLSKLKNKKSSDN